MPKPQPIRVGDKFQAHSGVWEVIAHKPGGKVELFDRDKSRFHFYYAHQVREWPRVTAPAN